MNIIRGYQVIVEKAGDNYSAYSPDLPGCVTTGPTAQQTLLNMREAIDFHIEGLQEYGYPVPTPKYPVELDANKVIYPTV